MVINMGLKSIRCIIFSRTGVKCGSASVAINTAINDIRVEQNPEEWWDKTQQVISAAIKDAQGAAVDYITVTTSAACLVCTDITGNAIGRALMVSDKRAEEEAAYIASLPSFRDVKKRTGLSASASLMLPKILWIKRHKTEVFEETVFFLTPNDYLIQKLCGVVKTDYLNAAKYHYDHKTGKYPQRLLKELGIPAQKLPEATETGTLMGTVKREIADATGIRGQAKVVLSTYDAICSFIGSGVIEEGEASDVSGTVTVLRTLTRKKSVRRSEEVYNLPFRQGGFNIVGGSNNMGGGLIEWVKQCYYQNEENPYLIMEQDARDSDVGAGGLVFLPYLLGERAPIWDDEARGVFFGLERMHTRKDMTRAVFESAGFIDLDIIEAIRKTGAQVASVRLSGGLARVGFISQLKADIMGRDVLVLSEFETTSTGAAMIALTGQGVFKNLKEAADRFVSIRMIIKPDLEHHKKYDAMYQLYKDTYLSLKPLFRRRQETVRQLRSDREIQIENL